VLIFIIFQLRDAQGGEKGIEFLSFGFSENKDREEKKKD